MVWLSRFSFIFSPFYGLLPKVLRNVQPKNKSYKGQKLKTESDLGTKKHRIFYALLFFMLKNHRIFCRLDKLCHGIFDISSERGYVHRLYNIYTHTQTNVYVYWRERIIDSWLSSIPQLNPLHICHVLPLRPLPFQPPLCITMCCKPSENN